MKTTKEVFRSVLKELGFDGHKPSQMSNSDYWLCTNTAMEKFAEHHHQSKIDAITDEMIEERFPERNKSGFILDGNLWGREGIKWFKQELKK